MMSEIEINRVNSSQQIKPKFGEIYKCAFYDEAIGTEIKGLRPVLIISTIQRKFFTTTSKRVFREKSKVIKRIISLIGSFQKD
jgi:hypothetical protein